MRIVDGALADYACPFAETYRTATATHDTREGLIVHVATDEGTLGLGEAAPLSNRTEPLEEARAALEAALATLGAGEWTVDEALASLDEIVPSGARSARFGLALALAEARAQGADRSLAADLAERHLDGRRPADRVPVNATVPDQEPEAAAERAREAAASGFEAIKLKAGRRDFEADLDRLDAVLEAAPEARIRLDANGAWRSLDEARRRIQHLASYPLEYVEQPLPADDLEAMARLRGEAEVPIAADEPALDPRSARAVILARACDVLVVKPTVLGGPRRALQVARLAEREAVDVVVTTTIDAAIARAGVLHVAAALGSTERAHGLATGWMLEDEPAAFDERVEEGAMAVPEGPGHGARRDREATRSRTWGES